MKKLITKMKNELKTLSDMSLKDENCTTALIIFLNTFNFALLINS